MTHDNKTQADKQRKRNDKYAFGKKLEKLLADNGISQTVLAEKTGIHESTISRMISRGERMTGKSRERIVLIIKALQDEGVFQNIDEANNLLDKANLGHLSGADPIEKVIIQIFEVKSKEPPTIRETPSEKYKVEPERPTKSDRIAEISSARSLLQISWTSYKIRYFVLGVIVLVASIAFIIWARPLILTWWELRKIEGVLVSSLPENGQVFYTTSFDDNVGSEWSSSSTAEAANGAEFLGEFGVDDEVNLNIENLGPHESVIITFDLYIIRSWDGNYEGDYIFGGQTYRVGPDIWGMKSDGRLLMKTTFSNNTGQYGLLYKQAYPDNYGQGDYSPGYGAREENTLGYEYNGYPMDAIYEIMLQFEHDTSNLNLSFFSDAVELQETSRGFESFNTIYNESWGIDNLQIILVEDQ